MQQTFASGGTATASDPGTGVAAHRQDRYHRRREGHVDDRREHQGRHRGLGGQRRRRGEPSRTSASTAARRRRRVTASGPRSWSSPTTSTAATTSPSPTPSAFKQVLVDVPEVAGLSLDAAKQAIEAAGFVFEDGGQQDSNHARGHRLGHRPLGPGRSWHHDPRVHEQRQRHDGPRPHRHERCSRPRPRSTRPGCKHEGRQRQPDRQRREPEPGARAAPPSAATRSPSRSTTAAATATHRATVERRHALACRADRHRDRRGRRCRVRLGLARRAHPLDAAPR